MPQMMRRRRRRFLPGDALAPRSCRCASDPSRAMSRPRGGPASAVDERRVARDPAQGAGRAGLSTLSSGADQARRWVVDASVPANWPAPVPESALAESPQGQGLAAPDLLHAEVADILCTKQARGELAAATARAAVRWLQRLPLEVAPAAGLAAEALALAMRLGHPACDGFCFALAVAGDRLLSTAGRRQLERRSLPDAGDLASRVVGLGALAAAQVFRPDPAHPRSAPARTPARARGAHRPGRGSAPSRCRARRA